MKNPQAEHIFGDPPENRQVNEQIEKGSRTLKSIFDGIDDVIYVADPETYELLSVNAAFKNTWGEDVVGKKCFRVLQGRESPCPFCTNHIIFGEYLGRTYLWEFQNQVDRRWYRCADKVIHWLDGRMVRFELASDITAMKNTELELSRSKRELEIRNRIAEVFLTIADEEIYVRVLDIILEALDSKYGVFGYLDEAGDLIVPTMSRHIWSECQVSDKTIVFPRAKWSDTIWPSAIRQKRILHSNERSKLTPQGHIKVERNIAVPIIHREQVIGLFQVANKAVDYDADDLQLAQTIANAIAPILDARLKFGREEKRRKEAEQQLKRHAIALQRSNKELEQFAYVASHDLQEPLRMVASYTQLLGERYRGKLDDKADKYINYAVDGARRMQALINDLLAFSRVNTRGKEFIATDCAKVVNNVLQMLSKTIEENDAQIVVEDLPTVTVDRSQLTQVFQNLIGNAVKFRGTAQPRVKISARIDEADWEFCVADNGIGIDPKFHERIFVAFQRLHQRNEYPGNGIGLAIVKKIVERHDGNIRIESTPGTGTRFYFTIPKLSTHRSSDNE